MKTLKKLLAIVVSVMMVLSLAVPAFAANTTITINTAETGSEFAAYRLLDATDGGDGKIAYTVNETYRTVLQDVTSKTNDADIIAHIAEMSSDSAEIRTFADAVYAKVKNMNPDETTTTGTFENVAQGYYLIVETKVGTNSDKSTGSYSLVMLDTAGKDDVTIAAKEDTPTVVKKLKETNDSTGQVTDWQDGADYDLEDSVPFQLTGTVSSKIADYETYYYEFHDTLSKGLTYNDDAKVYIVNGEEKVDVTTSFVITSTTNENGTTSLSVKCSDIKSITTGTDEDGNTVENVTIGASTKIVVEYTATLNSNAVIGSTGNPNVVYLEYSNNPYDKGDGETKPETGKTPDDEVIVFTYQVVVNKVDGNGNPLAGAKFTLYKKNASTGKYEPVGTEQAATPVYQKDDEGNYTNTVIAYTFGWTHIDAGDYKLVETAHPDGYNQADDLYFTVEATYDIDDADPQLKTLVVKDANGDLLSDPDDEDASFTATMATGVVSTDVENLSGTELPSTGGIGTTIFYVVGGVLVVAAGVLLITKKRMGSKD